MFYFVMSLRRYDAYLQRCRESSEPQQPDYCLNIKNGNVMWKGTSSPLTFDELLDLLKIFDEKEKIHVTTLIDENLDSAITV